MRLLLVLLLAANAQAAEVYRCVAEGKTTYADRPCAANAERIAVAPNGTGTGMSPDELRIRSDLSSAQRSLNQQAQAQADAAWYAAERQRYVEDRSLAEQRATRKAIEKLSEREVYYTSTPRWPNAKRGARK